MVRLLSLFKPVMAGLLLLPALTALAAEPGYREIEFSQLLPDADYQALSKPPAALASIAEGSLEDQIEAAVGAAADQAGKPLSEWDRALQSVNVRPEFNAQKIRIPGYVVPIEFNDDQVVTEFFLVPYYGACIHLPPPPPNQLILMRSEKGITMETIYDPYWVNGTLYTDEQTNDIATSAYRMDVDQIEPYHGG